MDTNQLINDKHSQIATARDYLRETDYHNDKYLDDVQRGVEPPYHTPASILIARENARADINRLQADIVELKKQLADESTLD